MSNLSFRINRQISASEIRLLREDGTQIGVIPLSEALSQAQIDHLDLVEIAPLAKPPVVKLIDYKKFLYQLAKKEKEAKASAKKVDLKEVRLTPFMAQNDFQTRIDRAKEFLEDGHKVKITVKFVGRQLTHKEFGDQMMTRVYAALSESASVDQVARWLGKLYQSTLTPIKKIKKHETKN